jgi:hypothetical protein
VQVGYPPKDKELVPFFNQPFMDFDGARFAFTLFLKGLFEEVARLIRTDRTLTDPKTWRDTFNGHKRACLYSNVVASTGVGDTSAPVLHRQLMRHTREV